ncbi:DUF4113 domain-containing protein [Arthrobacter wenxiniae]|uniref:DUF4113 domain-containing protein n=1 Tax=Arthrobacter wenxiniae TaxID=2713570 RepID=UPI003CCD77B8
MRQPLASPSTLEGSTETEPSADLAALTGVTLRQPLASPSTLEGSTETEPSADLAALTGVTLRQPLASPSTLEGDIENPHEQRRIGQLLEDASKKYRRESIGLGAGGIEGCPDWITKREILSPCYTTLGTNYPSPR